jgi:hypothetical protein
MDHPELISDVTRRRMLELAETNPGMRDLLEQAKEFFELAAPDSLKRSSAQDIFDGLRTRTATKWM